MPDFGLTLCETCTPVCTFFCIEDLECINSCAHCCPTEVRLGPNLALPRGQLLAQKASDGFYYPYNPAATDGLEIPKGVLKYHVHTDALGRVSDPRVPFFGTNNGHLTAIAWSQGDFRIGDIRGDLYAALFYPSFAKLVDGFVNPHTSGLMGEPNGQGIIRFL